MRLKEVINDLGFGADMRAKIRVIQLIIVLLVMIHLTTCYLFNLVSSQYNNLEADSFSLNFWMPPVDLNDLQTVYYGDNQKTQYAKSFYYAFLLITSNDIAP